MEQTPHIAIVPSPGISHLIPLIELAKQLVHHHDFRVKYIIPTSGPRLKAMKVVLGALPKTIESVFLPPASLDDLPQGLAIGAKVALTMTRSMPSLRHVLKSLASTTRLVALVIDPYGSDAIDVAKEFNVESYIFFTSTAMALSFLLHFPKLDESAPCGFRFSELQEPLRLPGCLPFRSKDLMDDALHGRNNENYKWLLYHSKRLHLVKGIMVNTFMELEAGAIKALHQESHDGTPPIYPIGPIVRMGSSTSNNSIDGSESCLRWLDNQPIGSVLFVSFGSGGTLSHDQLLELAMGLAMSAQRFLWVVRFPNNDSADAGYLCDNGHVDPLDILPGGFVELTKEQGLVVSAWAPQVHVLRHRSTGGFLSHCGWNSTLESVVHGIPLIAWPLHAEQKMNALMLVEDLKVAMRPKANEHGVVEREEVARVIKGLMEGEEGERLRNNMKHLKDAAAKVLREGGSSTRALSELASKWKRQADNEFEMA